MRRALLGLATAGLALAAVATTSTASWAHSSRLPHYTGGAPGSVTCSKATLSVTFTPNLTNSNAASVSATINGSAKHCTATEAGGTPTVTVSLGKFSIWTGQLSDSLLPSGPFDCGTATSGDPGGSATMTWKGSLTGTYGPGTDAGAATFGPSIITLASPAAVSAVDGNANPGLMLTGNAQEAPGASFGGAVSASLFDTKASSTLAKRCSKPTGVHKVSFTGTLSVGS